MSESRSCPSQDQFTLSERGRQRMHWIPLNTIPNESERTEKSHQKQREQRESWHNVQESTTTERIEE